MSLPSFGATAFLALGGALTEIGDIEDWDGRFRSPKIRVTPLKSAFESHILGRIDVEITLNLYFDPSDSGGAAMHEDLAKRFAKTGGNYPSKAPGQLKIQDADGNYFQLGVVVTDFNPRVGGGEDAYRCSITFAINTSSEEPTFVQV